MKRRSGPPRSTPVIDLFAGPGGLGEGFASFRDVAGDARFHLAISIEMEPWAHSTLQFRAFMRALGRPLRRSEWAMAAGSRNGHKGLMEQHPAAMKLASSEALRRTLGETDRGELRRAIQAAAGSAGDAVVIGGPPCQAYSLVGRSRNRGNASYVPESDHRQQLYLEYLQILADHDPAVFVMENVKGLKSASLHSQRLFDLIRSDLSSPSKALKREGRTPHGAGSEYRVYSLAPSEDFFTPDFVLRAERFGVPQARHRVILVGVRSDISARPPALTETSPAPTTDLVLQDLPVLRSCVSGPDHGPAPWTDALQAIRNRPWVRQVDGAVRKVIKARLKQITSDHGLGEMPVERAERPDHRLAWLGAKVPPIVLNHEARSHMPSDLERYFFAACWAEVNERSPSLAQFPEELLPEHRNVAQALNGGMFADRFRVQVAGRPSTTITSHIAKDGHYFIHYDPRQCRSLTVREAARLQTFPEDYLFTGPRTSQYQQVGNAVPPHLARQIAGSIIAVIDRQQHG